MSRHRDDQDELRRRRLAQEAEELRQRELRRQAVVERIVEIAMITQDPVDVRAHIVDWSACGLLSYDSIPEVEVHLDRYFPHDFVSAAMGYRACEPGLPPAHWTGRPLDAASVPPLDLGVARMPLPDLPSNAGASPSVAPGVYSQAAVAGLQLKEADSDDEDGVAELVAEARRSARGALPDRERLEAALGADLSGVAVASGDVAARASDALGAEAFADDELIVLGDDADLETIAHEAVHVIQRRQGRRPTSAAERERLEAEADDVAAAVVRGGARSQHVLAEVAADWRAAAAGFAAEKGPAGDPAPPMARAGPAGLQLKRRGEQQGALVTRAGRVDAGQRNAEVLEQAKAAGRGKMRGRDGLVSYVRAALMSLKGALRRGSIDKRQADRLVYQLAEHVASEFWEALYSEKDSGLVDRIVELFKQASFADGPLTRRDLDNDRTSDVEEILRSPRTRDRLGERKDRDDLRPEMVDDAMVEDHRRRRADVGAARKMTSEMRGAMKRPPGGPDRTYLGDLGLGLVDAHRESTRGYVTIRGEGDIDGLVLGPGAVIRVTRRRIAGPRFGMAPHPVLHYGGHQVVARERGGGLTFYIRKKKANPEALYGGGAKVSWQPLGPDDPPEAQEMAAIYQAAVAPPRVSPEDEDKQAGELADGAHAREVKDRRSEQDKGLKRRVGGRVRGHIRKMAASQKKLEKAAAAFRRYTWHYKTTVCHWVQAGLVDVSKDKHGVMMILKLDFIIKALNKDEKTRSWIPLAGNAATQIGIFGTKMNEAQQAIEAQQKTWNKLSVEVYKETVREDFAEYVKVLSKSEKLALSREIGTSLRGSRGGEFMAQALTGYSKSSQEDREKTPGLHALVGDEAEGTENFLELALPLGAELAQGGAMSALDVVASYTTGAPLSGGNRAEIAALLQQGSGVAGRTLTATMKHAEKVLRLPKERVQQLFERLRFAAALEAFIIDPSADDAPELLKRGLAGLSSHAKWVASQLPKDDASIARWTRLAEGASTVANSIMIGQDIASVVDAKSRNGKIRAGLSMASDLMMALGGHGFPWMVPVGFVVWLASLFMDGDDPNATRFIELMEQHPLDEVV